MIGGAAELENCKIHFIFAYIEKASPVALGTMHNQKNNFETFGFDVERIFE